MKSLNIFAAITLLIAIIMYGWTHLYISEENREVPFFNSIHTSGPINVYIQESDEALVTVRGDNKFLEQVIVEVLNGSLKVYTNGRISGERVLDVYINYTKLDSIHVTAQSTLTGRGVLHSESFEIKASISAEVKLQIESDTLDLKMYDSANVQLAGSAQNFDLLITDVGDLMAYNMESQHARVHVDTQDQSPGIARINVQQTLDATIKGPRLVKFKGEAIVTNEEISRGGKLISH